MFKVPNQYRVKDGPYGSDDTFGNNGMFEFSYAGYSIRAIAGSGLGWEHVSVSIDRRRTPSWEVMNYVKDLFWGKENTVVQFHPKKSEYVNCHPYVLHLWRKIGYEFPLPDKIMV